jgi:hypothetical protein
VFHKHEQASKPFQFHSLDLLPTQEASASSYSECSFTFLRFFNNKFSEFFDNLRKQLSDNDSVSHFHHSSEASHGAEIHLVADLVGFSDVLEEFHDESTV